MSAAADLRSALAFLSPIGGRGTTPSPRTMAYFPLVGWGLGLGLGKIWERASLGFGPVAGAALTVAADAALTGALHLDGVADAADGILAHAPAKSRLEIMAGPEVGAFGAVALGCALLLRTAAFSAQPSSAALLGALYCSSRSVMVVASRLLPYARADGLASAFLPPPGPDPSGQGPGPHSATRPVVDAALVAALAGGASAAVVASLSAGRRGAAAVLAGWAGAAAVLGLARHRLGGFTGDVLGASAVVSETTGLVLLSRTGRDRAPHRRGFATTRPAP
jgi:adenosylcobinamide-GDP ribazoletransferase